MKQHLTTAIDFHLQSQKTNPFILHLSSNSSSSQLENLRNQCYILNKLTLLNLEHQDIGNGNGKMNQNGRKCEEFVKEVLELYAVCLDGVINNPLMPYKDYESVRDLISKIEHYHHTLSKLTSTPQDWQGQSSLKKKLRLNEFWPRIRAYLMSIQEKIPASHYYIKEYVTIRRGLLENDKSYFVAQMMAKKVCTEELKQLIQIYQAGQTVDTLIASDMHKEQEELKIERMKIPSTIPEAKMLVRALAIQYNQEEWDKLKNFLHGSEFQSMETNAKQNFIEYIKDVLGEKSQDIFTLSN